MKKLVLFGAGKIGRSFIGQLFSKSGYEVVFIDINPVVIDEMNKRHEYKVFIKGNKEEVIIVNNIRGVLGTQKELVIEEVATADIIATSVGQQGLPHILPNIAAGLLKRKHLKGDLPLDIILAENLRNADQYVKSELKKILPIDYSIENLVGFVETSIGKMVPIMPKAEEEKDVLQVFAEAYNTLILDKKAFKNSIPEVTGLAPKDNMKAWVDRKAFVHNFGHAAVSYLGFMYNPAFVYLYEALAVNEIKAFVRKVMLQSSEILMAKYPGEFTIQQLTEHTDDLIERFENKALGDTIFRVGCDLPRKLSKNDRIVSVILDGISLHKPVENILFVLVAGLYFKAVNESGNMFPSDIDFHKDLMGENLISVLNKYCGLTTQNHPEEVLKIQFFFKKFPTDYLNMLKILT